LSNFETWSTHQCCEQVSLSDLPAEFQEDVGDIFGVTKRIPLSWLDRVSRRLFMSPNYYVHYLQSFDCSPAFAKFITDASHAAPELFSDEVTHASDELFEDVCVVFSAWRRLVKMRNSKEKWSEADFVVNV